MTRDFPAGNLRVSDAERDAALAELSEHFQAGRITQEEFDERSGLALRAKTGDDLHTLFTDLPGTEAPESGAPADDTPQSETPLPPMPRQQWAPSRSRPRSTVTFIVVACVIASVIIANVTSAVSQASGSHHVVVNTGWVVPVVIALLVLRRVGRR